MEPLTPESHETNDWTPTRGNSSTNSSAEMRRKGIIARQFRRMAISSQQPVPGQERLLLLVEDAYRLWDEIPEPELTETVDEAIIRSGSFMPTAGLVVQCWRSRKEKLPVLGSGTKKTELQTRTYLAWLRKVEREKAPPEFVSRFCRAMIARIEGRSGAETEWETAAC